MQSTPSQRQATVALIGGAVAIGFAPIMVRLALIGPSAVGFYRVLFALPVLWILLQREQSRPSAAAPPRTVKDFAALGMTGILFYLDLAVWHWSLEFTTVANSTLLANLAPLFVTIGAWIFFRERITSQFVVGMLMALVGATALIGASATVSMENVLGDSIAACSAVVYAAYVLYMKHVRSRFGAATIMTWSGLVSCPLFLISGWAMNDSFTPPTSAAWCALLCLALITHVGGQTLISFSLGKLPASITSAALFLQPIMAAGLAWVLLNEPLTLVQTAGGIIALLGITVATRSR